MSPKYREMFARQEGGKIHPQYSDEFESSFSVSWENTPYSVGGFAHYSQSDRDNYYPLLDTADDALFLAGEHVSYLTGWMAGAFESAHRVIEQIHTRVVNH